MKTSRWIALRRPSLVRWRDALSEISRRFTGAASEKTLRRRDDCSWSWRQGMPGSDLFRCM